MRVHLDRFRVVAFAEGVSFLALLGFAMPLKYALGIPIAVKVVGWIHGILFMLYVAAGALAAREQRWTFAFVALAFVAALIPFGTFVLDRRLRPDAAPSETSE